MGLCVRTVPNQGNGSPPIGKILAISRQPGKKCAARQEVRRATHCRECVDRTKVRKGRRRKVCPTPGEQKMCWPYEGEQRARTSVMQSWELSEITRRCSIGSRCRSQGPCSIKDIISGVHWRKSKYERANHIIKPQRYGTRPRGWPSLGEELWDWTEGKLQGRARFALSITMSLQFFKSRGQMDS